MYSLVNVAVAVRDLARHPRGAAVAADLLHVLALDEPAFAELDMTPLEATEDVRRAAALAQVEAELRALPLLATVRSAAAVAGLSAWSAGLDALESAPMGGAAELIRWLREELLAGCWESAADVAVARRQRALDVVTDGVLGSYLGEPEIGRGWQAWTRGRPIAALPEPAAAHVVELVTRSAPSSHAAVAAALRTQRAAGWSWPHAMHDACWAVELTGRTQLAAAAQLQALVALRNSHGDEIPSYELVAAVIAAMHATVVADLLPHDQVAAMCRPLLGHLE
jgi:membrane-associated phospholipid phosphatase